ncbi:hypothetical protein I4F81_002592 [Pyropia yezoensis]|uniref:Uncharacterized protein n=1 Tax=Pyropia yezoensis TaxID=2788 RepID=A0ACC3BQI4_PYRYE|nr:hypothetical protein I4F81_002592 [Neopyropia yezoensis]
MAPPTGALLSASSTPGAGGGVARPAARAAVALTAAAAAASGRPPALYGGTGAIESLDSGHASDDSARSVDSVTSVDVLALDTAKAGPDSGKAATAVVHLIAGRPLDRPADVQSDRDHLSFEADDVEAVAACLRDRGIPFKDEEFPTEGLRQLFFHEPSSHIMVEVCNCQHFAVVPLTPPPARGGRSAVPPPPPLSPTAVAACTARPTDVTAATVAAAAAAAAAAAVAVPAGLPALPVGGSPPGGAAAAVRAAP